MRPDDVDDDPRQLDIFSSSCTCINVVRSVCGNRKSTYNNNDIIYLFVNFSSITI